MSGKGRQKCGAGSGGLDRRTFVKAATAGTGALLAGIGSLEGEENDAASPSPGAASGAPAIHTRQTPDVAVVGAGAFGAWTALNLQQAGARVTLIDQYGPANSRATSGGETRGVRTGYGDRGHGLLWTRWAKRAIEKWRAWDEHGRELLLPRVFFTTSDLIMRDEWTEFMEDTRKNWDEAGVGYEVLDADEVGRRWPVIDLTDITVALWEPDAGVVRARRAIESVAQVFEQAGGTITIARADTGPATASRLDALTLQPGESVSAGTYVFALGPWFPKAFPELMGNRLRIPMGNVVYLRTPPGDNRYSYPNLPSYNFPGVTGWPALGPDNRGFRVRRGGRGPDDPDTSRRWLREEEYESPLAFVRERFPGLADAPVSETRSCHYEISLTSNFFFDHHPDYDNIWLAGGGSAEGFKFGPVIGEYLAGRILGTETDPELIEAFRLSEEEFEPR
ncbi:MAG: FAD-dependent oxidoreductase [Gemmatimonadetes bacterium]|nr:FAD-dependent oxidoreductase [Gemmatimonadota bacterium]MYA42910.1 FAD-dependent oxidoreductase [Gemmatimonadota bacterium]MYE93737.1 FAD-dependent oxidoreductase [Gemmatimonadota bacterium]MYJ09408.1 FAD-dependent oxidoreductase [Gemmatimonadota bacterium]